MRWSVFKKGKSKKMPKKVIKRTTKNTKIILSDLFNALIDEKNNEGLAPKTLKNYSDSYYYMLDVMDIDDSDWDIRKFDAEFVFNYTTRLRARDISVASVNTYLRCLKVLVKYAAAKGWLEEPEIKLVKEQERAPKAFTTDEVEILLEKPEEDEDYPIWRTWTIVNLVCSTGARASTICNLRIEDLDFRAGYITFTATKNKKLQRNPLGGTLVSVLKRFIEEWRGDAAPDEWLFPSITGEKLTTNGLSIAFRKYCRARGVERTSIHSLRHSYAVSLAKHGLNAYQIATLMGHSDITTSSIYIKLYGEDFKENYSSVNLLDTIKRENKAPIKNKRIKRR